MSRPPEETPDDLARARSACDARSWREAHELLRDADRRGALGPEGLELLADCARWTGRIDELFDPLERAHASYVANQTVAAVWMKRAGELLAGA